MSLKTGLARYGKNVQGNAGLRAYATERAESERRGNRPAGSEMPSRKNLTTSEYQKLVGDWATRASAYSGSYGKGKNAIHAEAGSDPSELAEKAVRYDSKKGLAAVGRRVAVTALAGVAALGIAAKLNDSNPNSAPDGHTSSVSHESHVAQAAPDFTTTPGNTEMLPGPTDIPTLPQPPHKS